MANLYELTADMENLQQLLESGELDAEMVEGAIETLTEDIDLKIEAYCKWIKNLEGDIEAIKAEQARLADKKARTEKTIAWAKDTMLFAMNRTGKTKIKGAIFTASVQKNPPTLKLDAEGTEKIPEKYLIEQPPKINKKAMLEDIKAGAQLDGVAHIEQGEGVRIR